MTHYEQLPADVQDAAVSPDDEPDEWHRVDPTDVPTADCAVCDETLYRVPLADESCWRCGAHTCYVNKWGEIAHGEHVGDPAALSGGYNLALEDDDSDASHVMCGHCSERFGEGNTVVVVTPDGDKFSVPYEGTVIRDINGVVDSETPPISEAPDLVWDAIRELVCGGTYVSTDGWRGYHTGPSETDGLSKVSSGWHSSMEQSKLSERINELTSGKFHRDTVEVQRVASDDLLEAAFTGEGIEVETVEKERDGPVLDFPIAVMFGRTSNVCSIGIDVYAPEDKAEIVKGILDKRAAPGHAGLR